MTNRIPLMEYDDQMIDTKIFSEQTTTTNTTSRTTTDKLLKRPDYNIRHKTQYTPVTSETNHSNHQSTTDLSLRNTQTFVIQRVRNGSPEVHSQPFVKVVSRSVHCTERVGSERTCPGV